MVPKIVLDDMYGRFLELQSKIDDGRDKNEAWGKQEYIVVGRAPYDRMLRRLQAGEPHVYIYVRRELVPTRS